MNSSVWYQTVIDHLYDFLLQKDFLIRYISAISITKLTALIGNASMSILSHKIRSMMISNLEKKDHIVLMDEYAGYMMTLGYLYVNSTENEVKSVILTTLFDCMHRHDYSAVFYAYILSTFSVICTSFGTGSDEVEVEDFLEKMQGIVMNIHANVISSEDYELFLLGMMSLLRNLITVIQHTSTHTEITPKCVKMIKSYWKVMKTHGLSAKYVRVVKISMEIWSKVLQSGIGSQYMEETCLMMKNMLKNILEGKIDVVGVVGVLKEVMKIDVDVFLQVSPVLC
jgi:hypothetical protein